TGFNKCVGIVVVHGTEALQWNTYHYVGILHGLAFVCSNYRCDRLSQHLEAVERSVGFGRRDLEVNAEDDLRSHFFDDADRNVVEQSSVNVDVSFVGDWAEDAWQRHRRAQRQCQRTTSEHVISSRDQIGSYTGKGNGQVVEALEIRIR